jgi:hypothetical protein
MSTLEWKKQTNPPIFVATINNSEQSLLLKEIATDDYKIKTIKNNKSKYSLKTPLLMSI